MARVQSSISAWRHNLINEEFREAFSFTRRMFYLGTKGVIVLSAPHSPEFVDDEFLREGNPENIARIIWGKYVLSLLTNNPLHRVAKLCDARGCFPDGDPRFILNGETEQLLIMKTVAIKIGVPEQQLVLVDSGKRGESHTGTQFQAVANHQILSKLNHLTIVTSDYHVPRVARTAKRWLPPSMKFDVVGAPRKMFGDYSVFRRVLGEMRRIVKYAANGQIVRDL